MEGTCKVKGKQWPLTDTSRTKVPPSKPKLENRHNLRKVTYLTLERGLPQSNLSSRNPGSQQILFISLLSSSLLIKLPHTYKGSIHFRFKMAETIGEVLSESMNEFTFDVYKTLAAGKADNLFMSASSVMVAMTMVHAGARGNTKSQMTDTLRLEKVKENEIYAAFEEFVRLLKQSNSDFTLRIANKLYPHNDNAIKDEYLDIIKKHFMSDTKSLDYVSNTEDSRIEINKWVEEETEEKIKDLLAPGII